MAANNLRIIYSNKATAVSGTFIGNSSNLLNEYKSSTATLNAASFTVTAVMPSGTPIGIVLLLAETTGSISMTVSGTGVSASASDTSVGSSSVTGFGGEKYLAAYCTTSATTGTITITIPSGTKISRVIVGEYWSPVFNTPFGLSVGYNDASTQERTQSGDLYTINAPRNKVLTFSLPNLTDSDKFKFFDILKSYGKRTPIFVSLFPSDTDQEKEQMFSIYGKFTDLTTITHSMWTIYSSSISLEEI